MKRPMIPFLPGRVWTLLRHLWRDERGTVHALPPAARERLRARVVASEARHTGQIRICVEARLPTSYLLRHVRERIPMPALVHQRALMMFSKLRVWDTERNNGVLIYLQRAERLVEFVADRGLNADVTLDEWQTMVAHLSTALAAEQFEEGLLQAIDEVTAPLVRCFPRALARTDADNELPDDPVVR